jgi:PPOX class probable F420-dependent enzyme
MRKNIAIENLRGLLNGSIVATLATYRRDGSVLLSPVWHEWRDGGFTVVAVERDIKAKHVRRDPRAVLVVYESSPPYAGVEIRSHATLISDRAADAERRLAVRYLGDERGMAYAARPRAREIIIRLEPGELRTWDFADYDW